MRFLWWGKYKPTSLIPYRGQWVATDNKTGKFIGHAPTAPEMLNVLLRAKKFGKATAWFVQP